jgi:Glyoxalase/Bleomycin resistance protein/Dioxygenase superfamily
MSRVFGDIRQVGYVTANLDAAMAFFVEKLGIGPWFVLERASIPACTYLGAPLELEMSIALANSGSLQIELIQQRSPAPSLYTEWLQLHPRGDVVHHYSAWSDTYDEVHARALGLGWEAVQEGRSSYGPFAYFRNRLEPNLIYEVTAYTPPRRRTFEQIAEAAAGWDGGDPVRIGWPDANA